MSVTFTVHPLPVSFERELRFWCDLPTRIVDSIDSDVDAAAHALVCSECAGYGGPLAGLVLPFAEMNLANANAAELLTLLGFAGDELYAGSADAELLLGRLLVADALLVRSEAKPERVDFAPGRATVIDLGRPAGYLNEKVERLACIARFALDTGAEVIWS